MLPDFITDSLAHWPLFVFWYLVFLFIEKVASPVFLRWLYTPAVWDAMSPEDQYLLNGRTGAILHAFSAFFEIPLWYRGATSDACIADPSYCMRPATQQWYAYATGYYMWDLQYSIVGGEVQFIFHASISFLVFFFGLRPFVHISGMFFHGVFALSTPWLHLRDLCDKMEPRTRAKDAFSLAMAVSFALSFALVRVVAGSYFSYHFIHEMLGLLAQGRAHSLTVVYFMIVANSLIMILQIYWLKEIVTQAAALFGSPGKKTD